jgi:hypothetical protein
VEVKGEPVRLAELLAALSLATDLGMDQPRGHAVQTCVLSVQLARDLQLSDDRVSDVFYVALLRYLGCTADASEVARLAGDAWAQVERSWEPAFSPQRRWRCARRGRR